MATYTKEEFKELWEANDQGSGLTFNDVADCAKAWGIASTPRIMQINLIQYRVLKAANVIDYEDYKPQEKEEEY